MIFDFVTDSSHAWLQKRRLELVSEARQLILEPDRDVVSVGIDLPPEDGGPGENGSALEDRHGWSADSAQGSLLARGDSIPFCRQQQTAHPFCRTTHFHLLSDTVSHQCRAMNPRTCTALNADINILEEPLHSFLVGDRARTEALPSVT